MLHNATSKRIIVIKWCDLNHTYNYPLSLRGIIWKMYMLFNMVTYSWYCLHENFCFQTFIVIGNLVVIISSIGKYSYCYEEDFALWLLMLKYIILSHLLYFFNKYLFFIIFSLFRYIICTTCSLKIKIRDLWKLLFGKVREGSIL